jgi:2-dehydropantoate 2-reductase
MKIALIGVGGTGGYLGGLLVRAGMDVCLIARPKTVEAIRNSGLRVHSEINGDFTAHPAFLTEDPRLAASAWGTPDLLFICVKGYSFAEAARAVAPIVSEETVVIPLLNGVGHGATAAGIIGRGRVLDACIYMTSRSSGPGVVIHTDRYNKMVIGVRAGIPAGPDLTARLELIAVLVNRAGMECHVSGDIEASVWEKFNFNCAFSVLTALHEADAEQIRSNPEWMVSMRRLSEETASVAKAIGIRQPDDIVERSMRILAVMRPEGTSSMKRDVEAGKPSELELFSGTLCRLAEAHGIPVPESKRIYMALLRKTSS